MKRRVLRKASGAVAGGAVMLAFMGAVGIHAEGADTSLPPEYIQYCEEAGRAYNVCPELLEAVIEAESGGDPYAVGAAGETGLMQVYPEYHMGRMGRLGVASLSDPKGNIFVGADYLAELFLEYGDAGTVLMVYNGTENAEARGSAGDYTGYAEGILGRSAQLERLHKK